MLKLIVFITCLLVCISGFTQAAKNVAPKTKNGSDAGNGKTLTLTTLTSQLIEGTLLKGKLSIDFSRPGALTISVLGTPLLSVCDFGAFLKVSIGGKIFLVASAPDLLNRVIDITNKVVNLPANLDGSELLSLTANLDIFKSLLVGLPITNLLECEKRFAGLMIDLSATVELELLVDLSIELALRGINGFTHICSQPIHLTALRLLKIRADINIDVDLIARANALVSVDASVTLPGSCDLVNSCGNKCLGQCGVDCNCFKWVCGGCGGFLGCRNQDCGCDCKSTTSWLCVNLAVTRCTGVFNGCNLLGVVNDLVGLAL